MEERREERDIMKERWVLLVVQRVGFAGSCQWRHGFDPDLGRSHMLCSNSAHASTEPVFQRPRAAATELRHLGALL